METTQLLITILDLKSLGFKSRIGKSHDTFQAWEYNRTKTKEKAWYGLNMIWVQRKEHWIISMEVYVGDEGATKAYTQPIYKKKVKTQEKLVRILAQANYPPAVKLLATKEPQSELPVKEKISLNRTEILEIFDNLSNKKKIKILLVALEKQGSKEHKIASAMGYRYSDMYSEATWTKSPYA